MKTSSNKIWGVISESLAYVAALLLIFFPGQESLVNEGLAVAALATSVVSAIIRKGLTQELLVSFARKLVGFVGVFLAHKIPADQWALIASAVVPFITVAWSLFEKFRKEK